MSYTICNVYPLGIEYTGIAIRAQLYSSTNVAVGSAISSGFYERGGAQGIWAHTLVVPDAHVGWCDIYDNAAPTVVLASFAINPQEVENTDAKTSLTATAASLATVATYVDTEVAAIKAKTDNLPSDPADESSIQATLAAIAAYIDTEIAAIKAKTDNLPSDPADESSIQASIAALSAAVTVIDDFLDTEIATIITNLATVDTVVDGIAADVDALGATNTITLITSVVGDDITVYRNDTWEFTSTITLALTSYEAVAFVVKKGTNTADNDSLLYIRSDTGMVRMNGATATSNKGTLTVDSATVFSVLVDIDQTNVEPNTYQWWLKVFDITPTPDKGRTVASGKFMVKPYGLRAIA